jgi:hypothetical protein
MPKYKAWAKANPLCYVSLLAMMRERLYQTTDRNTDIADFARFRDEVRAQLAKVREQGRQRRKRKRKPLTARSRAFLALCEQKRRENKKVAAILT